MKKETRQSSFSETHIPSNADLSQNSRRKKSNVLIILIIILILVIGTLGATIYLLSNKDDSSNGPSASKRDTLITLDNRDEVLADLNKKVSDGLFEVQMNMEWSFKNASAPSENAYVANAATNSNTVYFTVTLDDTGEVVYDSPYIPVGYALRDISLQKALAAGTYPCTLTYHLVDENEKEVSNLALAVTLNVLE